MFVQINEITFEMTGKSKRQYKALFCQTKPSLNTTESIDCFAGVPLPLVASSVWRGKKSPKMDPLN